MSGSTSTPPGRGPLLLAGPPRSGTTLTCELLNRLSDVRALDEPLPIGKLIAAAAGDEGGFDAEGFGARIREFAGEQRASLLRTGLARTKHVNGRVIGAKVSDERGEDGLRTRMRELGDAALGVPATENFTLVIKHPVAFTALLGDLRGAFDVAAVVRHPLAILESWESVPMQVRDGRVPMLRTIAPAIHDRLEAIDDRLDRQVELLSWMFEQIATHAPPGRVVRYEEVVATGGAALAALAPSARDLTAELTDRNAVHHGPAQHRADMLRRLVDRDGPYWRYYAAEDPGRDPRPPAPTQ